MSTFIRARCLFLLHVGAGCQALSLGRPRAHHKGRHAQHERPSAQPLDGQIPNVSDNKSECVTWKMNGGGRLGNQFSGLATALFEAEMCGRSCVASTDLQRKVFSNLFNLPRVITLSEWLRFAGPPNRAFLGLYLDLGPSWGPCWVILAPLGAS